jgi:hypothetical protein
MVQALLFPMKLEKVDVFVIKEVTINILVAVGAHTETLIIV